MSIAPTELEHLELLAQFDENITCEYDKPEKCEKTATHRLIHKPCGFGMPLCTEHAALAVLLKHMLGPFAALLGKKCIARQKALRFRDLFDYKVVPIL